jgi:hypothetical protein
MSSSNQFVFKKKSISLDDNENVRIDIKKNSQDRKIDMDVLSNKDVNIGLDLLVNPDKQRRIDTSQPSTPTHIDTSKPVIDFDKDDDDLDFNNMLSKSNKSQENIEQLMSRMNLDDDIPQSSSNDKQDTFLDDIKHTEKHQEREVDVDSHRSLREDEREERRSYNDYDSGVLNYIADSKQAISVNSFFISEDYNDILKQLLVADEIYWMYDEEEDRVRPLTITNQNIVFKTGVVDKLIQYQFDFNFGQAYKLII